MSERMAIALLCRTMQWTWHDYVKQPRWFLDILKTVERLDGEKAAADQQEQERKAAEAARKAKRKR